MIEQVLSSTAFGKIIVVYGQIAENGHAVRKRTVPKMAITDKMVKNGRLSVKIQTFRTRFYGQMIQKAGFVRKSSSKWSKIYGQITENAGLSVKCVLLTDKSAKTKALSVNLNEVLARCPE